MRFRQDGRRRERDAAYVAEQTRAPPVITAPDGDLEGALSRLSPELRAVVVLREIEGMSHADIGRTLGISAGASRVRLGRGLERLRTMLRDKERR